MSLLQEVLLRPVAALVSGHVAVVFACSGRFPVVAALRPQSCKYLPAQRNGSRGLQGPPQCRKHAAGHARGAVHVGRPRGLHPARGRSLRVRRHFRHKHRPDLDLALVRLDHIRVHLRQQHAHGVRECCISLCCSPVPGGRCAFTHLQSLGDLLQACIALLLRSRLPAHAMCLRAVTYCSLASCPARRSCQCFLTRGGYEADRIIYQGKKHTVDNFGLMSTLLFRFDGSKVWVRCDRHASSCRRRLCCCAEVGSRLRKAEYCCAIVCTQWCACVCRCRMRS